MKSTLVACLLAAGLFSSCSKDAPAKSPVNEEGNMRYQDLSGLSVQINKPAVPLDLNRDGKVDLVFGIQVVGDPLFETDKFQFRVSSLTNNLLAVSPQESTPSLTLGEPIPVQDFGGFNWYKASSIVLMQKAISSNGETRWTGDWRKAGIQYLPVMVEVNGERFAGWVSLSVDALNEKINLHRAAVALTSGTPVEAGK